MLTPVFTDLASFQLKENRVAFYYLHVHGCQVVCTQIWGPSNGITAQPASVTPLIDLLKTRYTPYSGFYLTAKHRVIFSYFRRIRFTGTICLAYINLHNIPFLATDEHIEVSASTPLKLSGFCGQNALI